MKIEVKFSKHCVAESRNVILSYLSYKDKVRKDKKRLGSHHITAFGKISFEMPAIIDKHCMSEIIFQRLKCGATPTSSYLFSPCLYNLSNLE
jgi:hypothetical protein